MRALILFITCFCIGIDTAKIQAQTIDEFDLDDYRWKYRVLLVFSPNTYNSDYRDQARSLKQNRSGIQERDLKVFYALGQSSASAREQIIPDKAVQRLREHFDVSASNYTVILIGKDGTEKMRTNESVSTQKLFKEIDAMPMRKLEMKDGGKN